jgi:hypothetical protein
MIYRLILYGEVNVIKMEGTDRAVGGIEINTTFG